MRLSALLEPLWPKPAALPAGIDPEITRICEDSRLIRPGDLFIARPGTKADGSRYLADAARLGAVAAIVGKVSADVEILQIPVRAVAQAASVLANTFRGQPGDSLKVLGVTGTNGKTTTTYILRHLLATVGKRCGMIGTVEIDDGHSRREAAMTTPGAIEVADLLADMRDHACHAAAIEVSSHALDQHRVAGVRFAGAGFTNLTQDHLDYHGSMEQYAAAKAKLFEMLDENAVAAVSADGVWGDRMLAKCDAKAIRFGLSPAAAKADYRAADLATTAQGTHFILHTPDGNAEVSMPMIGRHNVENALCAASLAGEVFGLSVHQLAAGLKDAQGAPGRLQVIRAGQPFGVFVDYAHTDDGLANVLTALRPLTRGRLRVLFGCGGDRDAGKRPKMARVCEELADDVYVTSDNPRTEVPDAIIADIIAGFSTTDGIRIDRDRRSAINTILSDSKPGDVVLLAGKGHENYQIVGTVKHHFDDVEEATAALRAG